MKEYQFKKFNTSSTETQNTYRTKTINSIFKKTQEIEIKEIKETLEETPSRKIQKTLKLHQNIIKMLLKEVENKQKNINDLRSKNFDKFLNYNPTKQKKKNFTIEDNSGRNFLEENQLTEKEDKIRPDFLQQPTKIVNEEIEELNIGSSLDSKCTEDLFWNPQDIRLTQKTSLVDLIIEKIPKRNVSLNDAFQCEFIDSFSIEIFWKQNNIYDQNKIRNINFEIKKTEGN